MKPHPDKVLLVIYGEGGHRTEMNALVSQLQQASQQFQLVSYGCGRLACDVWAHYEARDIRSKHSRLKNLIVMFPLMFAQMFSVYQILRQYKISGVISTGPGLAIMPMLLCRILGIKTVFVETYCRFYSRSLTAKVMSKLAHRFLLQNQSLQALYPKGEYSGRL